MELQSCLTGLVPCTTKIEALAGSGGPVEEVSTASQSFCRGDEPDWERRVPLWLLESRRVRSPGGICTSGVKIRVIYPSAYTM